MTVLRQKNINTGLWEPIVVGAAGPTGNTGPVGPAGPVAIHVGLTPPTNTSLLWVDTS